MLTEIKRKEEAKPLPEYWDSYDEKFRNLHSSIDTLVKQLGWKDFSQAVLNYQAKKVDSNYQLIGSWTNRLRDIIRNRIESLNKP